MRLRDVLADNASSAFVNSLLLANNSDALAAGSCIWLQNVHILEIRRLTVNHPSFIVLWENIGGRCDVKGFSVQASHSLDVSPHEVFAANGPGSSEMVDVLLLIEVSKTALSKEACPNHIPSWTIHVAETGHFERVYHAVVSVSGLADSEARQAVRL